MRATEAADTPQMCGTHYCAVMYCCQQLLYLKRVARIHRHEDDHSSLMFFIRLAAEFSMGRTVR